MDIRRFFGGAGGAAKKPATTAAPAKATPKSNAGKASAKSTKASTKKPKGSPSKSKSGTGGSQAKKPAPASPSVKATKTDAESSPAKRKKGVWVPPSTRQGTTFVDDDDDDDDFVSKPAKKSKTESETAKSQAPTKPEESASAPEPTITHEVDEIDEEAALALLEEEDDVQGGGAAEELDDEDAAALAILEGEDDDNDEVQQKNTRTLDLQQFAASDAPNPFLTHGSSPKSSPRKSPKKEAKIDDLLKSPKKEKPRASMWSADAVTKLVTAPDSPTTEKNKVVKGAGAGALGAPESASKKRSSFAAFKNREGPRNLGSAEIPVGAPNCLSGLKFVVTGILETIEREAAEELIQKYGGKKQSSVNKSTSYAVVGRDAGPKKLELMEKFGTKQLDEHGLFDLIRTLPAKEDLEMAKAIKAAKAEAKAEKIEAARAAKKPRIQSPSAGPAASAATAQAIAQGAKRTYNGTPGLSDDTTGMLWSVKYAPTSSKMVAGQNGAKSPANKLHVWLSKWYANKERRVKGPKPKKASEDGWEFGACLMMGGPGVGKTTTAHLVCRELGYEVIELNASDTRSRKSLKETVDTLLGNTTVVQFFTKASTGQKGKLQALIMDEVDGMGSGDHGGLGELSKLIKTTKVPIICMANDKDSQKMRNFKNHCFVNNFPKIRVQNIKATVMKIMFKEGCKIDSQALEAVIEGANCDMRQILNNLQMWSRTSKSLTYDGVRKDVDSTVKDMKENPFAFASRFFSSRFHQESLDERIQVYFNDSSMAPNFVQEMYPSAAGPSHGKSKSPAAVQQLERLSYASDSIAMGDEINRTIYSSQQFGLLPLHAVISCVTPGYLLQNGFSGRIGFPSILGKISTKNKSKRLLIELTQHMRTVTSADTEDMRMTYLPFLRSRLIEPITRPEADIDEVISLLDEYHLSRDDWDSINDLCQLKGDADPTKDIQTKVKTAFTRTYNSANHAMPYAEDITTKKKKKGRASTSDDLELPEGDDDASALYAESDDESEALPEQVKKGKSKTSGKSSGKGKGKAKAKKT